MTISNRVEAILKASKDARNSDTMLQIIYMQKAGMNLTQHQIELFKSLPSMETLRRTRQKIQEGGKYPADKQVKKQRDFKSLQMQQITPKATPKYIEQTLNDGSTVKLPRGYRIAE